MHLPGHAFPVTFHRYEDGIACVFGKVLLCLRSKDGADFLGTTNTETIEERNSRIGISLSDEELERYQIMIELPTLKAGRAALAKYQMATFIEAREIGQAVGRGMAFNRWEWSAGKAEVKRLKVPPSIAPPIASSHEVSIRAKEWEGDWLTPMSEHTFEHIISSLDIDAVLLLQIILNLLLRDDKVIISLDKLMDMLGWQPRNNAERITDRNRIAEWLRFLPTINITGNRRESYGNAQDLSIDGPLFYTVIEGDELREFEMTDQHTLVTMVPSQWLVSHISNGAVLQRIGHLHRIVDIQDGKAQGKWARSIGMALYQYWREQANSAVIHRIGEANIVRARFQKQLTRHLLLTSFGCSPSVSDLIASKHAERAQQYWKGAVASLIKAKIVDSVDYPSIDAKKGPAFWDEWLHQEITVNPHKDLLIEIANIRHAHSQGDRLPKLLEQIREDYSRKSKAK
jgi:hypothetical protein